MATQIDYPHSARMLARCAGWSDSVPDDFLFSGKLARAITLQVVAIAPPGALDRQR